MNKVLCVFLAIVFICSVFAYGTNKRFSVAKWIDNLISLGNMTTIEDVVECWTESSYPYEVVDLETWVHVYVEQPSSSGGGYEFVYLGYKPLAYELDGSLTKRYDYEWLTLYNSNGTPYGKDGKYQFPIVLKEGQPQYYEDPNVEGDIQRFFNTVKGFFLRLGRSIRLIAEMFLDIFKNMGKLLPWNATVEVT